MHLPIQFQHLNHGDGVTVTDVFTDDVESGTILTTDTPAGKWDSKVISSGATLTAQTTVKYAGSYALKSTIPGNTSTWEYAEFQKALASAYATLYFAGFLRFSATPASGKELWIFDGIRIVENGATLVGLWLVNVSGVLKWRLFYYTDAGDVTVDSTTPAIAVDGFYFVEIMVTVHASAGLVKAWITPVGAGITEASPTLSVTGLANDNAGNAQFICASAVTPVGALAVSVYYDNIVAADIFIPYTVGQQLFTLINLMEY